MYLYTYLYMYVFICSFNCLVIGYVLAFRWRKALPTPLRTNANMASCGWVPQTLRRVDAKELRTSSEAVAKELRKSFERALAPWL